MAAELDDDFAQAGAGASLTYPMQASALRKGGHALVKDKPCKIIDMSTSKTGKHGHAKINMTGIDVFTGKKYETICQATHNMYVPVVTRKEFTLTDITDEDFTCLMDDSGDIREDLRVPEGDIGRQIKADFADDKEVVVTVMAAMGEEHILAARINANAD